MEGRVEAATSATVANMTKVDDKRIVTSVCETSAKVRVTDVKETKASSFASHCSMFGPSFYTYFLASAYRNRSPGDWSDQHNNERHQNNDSSSFNDRDDRCATSHNSSHLRSTHLDVAAGIRRGGQIC